MKSAAGILGAVVLAACSSVWAGQIAPASMQQGNSVRAGGLGQTYAALAHFEDPLSIALNPAGLGLSQLDSEGPAKSLAFSFSGGGLWRQSYTDFFGKQEFFSLAVRPGKKRQWWNKKLPVGLALYRSQFSLDDIKRVNAAGQVQSGSFGASDAVTALAMGIKINRLSQLPEKAGRLYAGFIWHHFSQKIDSFTNSGGDAVSLGLLYHWVNATEQWDVRGGLMLRHVPLQLMGYEVGKIKTDGHEDELPREIDLGLAVQAIGRRGSTTLALDTRFKEQGEWQLKPALELHAGPPGKGIVFRGGYRFDFGLAEGLDFQGDDSWVNGLNLGFGVRGLTTQFQQFADIQLDYALALSNGDRAIGNLHQLSITFVSQ